MNEIRTSRPFQERFLDGFDRSQLRLEVQKVKPCRWNWMKKKYATWALGASLAFGGLGIPMKVIQQAQTRGTSSQSEASIGTLPPIDRTIAGDLAQAQSIATQVAGGLQAVARGAEAATTSPLQAVEDAPRKLTVVTETAKEQFFKTEIPFGSIIYREARKNNLKPELVAAVVNAESRFKPTARSPRGAQGLMQLVPRTGRWMGAQNLMNPVENIAAGTKYLKYLNERFDGDERKVIAAYNAGEGNVKRFGGVPPFRETKNYLKKVRSFESELAQRIEGRATDAAMQIALAR